MSTIKREIKKNSCNSFLVATCEALNILQQGIMFCSLSSINCFTKDMTKKEKLIIALKAEQLNPDFEQAHSRADEMLIEYIGDKQIKKEYNKVPQYYA